MSRVAVVSPQIFHVAFELFNRSKNQTFCSAPSTVCAGRAFHTLGISTLPSAERIVAGGSSREIFVRERLCFLHVRRLFRTIAALICHNQHHIASPAKGSVPGETSYGGEIIWFLSKPVVVEPGDRRI